MRRAARTDGNQTEIIAALRAVGASVHDCSPVGSGFPDLCVGHMGRCYLLEVKDPSQPKNKQQLNPVQVAWHDAWRGHVAVVRTVQEALQAIGVAARYGD